MPDLQLSPGELAFVQRRRRRESQYDAARRHGMSRYRYRQWEKDEIKAPRELVIAPLEEFERCLIRRRREGLQVKTVADSIGVTPMWVSYMELGRAPATRLSLFWEYYDAKS